MAVVAQIGEQQGPLPPGVEHVAGLEFGRAAVARAVDENWMRTAAMTARTEAPSTAWRQSTPPKAASRNGDALPSVVAPTSMPTRMPRSAFAQVAAMRMPTG